MNANEKSYQDGREFAEYLNNTPREAQNWGKLDGLEIPGGSYVELKSEFGDCTDEMAGEWVRGFNEVFVPIN